MRFAVARPLVFRFLDRVMVVLKGGMGAGNHPPGLRPRCWDKRNGVVRFFLKRDHPWHDC